VRPGQALTLWGTGLGAVEGDEAAALVPSSVTGAGVDVFLGLQPGRVLYARSRRIRPTLSPHVSIASRGDCSDPHGMSEPVRLESPPMAEEKSALFCLAVWLDPEWTGSE
jgi:hypothetical protein